MPIDNDTHRAAPIDETATAALAARGLTARIVPVSDEAGFAAWLQVETRGFLEPEQSAQQVAAARERLGDRRMMGVYDRTTPEPDSPVASFATWVGEVSVPGGSGVPASVISSVTVSPTHRRRGIARAMMEAELRLAASERLPVAVLTASEATLYGRYGFAPAAASARWKLDIRRASWTGPIPAGRIDFISRERWRELAEGLHERVRLTSAGEIGMPSGHWDRFAGTRPDAKDPGRKRAIQYADADGEVRGLALYSAKEDHDDSAKSSVHIALLIAETADAYAALWRFFVELDLVGEVVASELSVDEPLLWMISDQRAATVTVSDLQYVRMLDVAAALEARRFGAPGRLLLNVSDPLGIAAGSWLLEVDADGVGTVTAGADASDAVVVKLGITELSAAYLGGVSIATLAAAGRVETTDAALAARVFGWHIAPRLSFWY